MTQPGAMVQLLSSSSCFNLFPTVDGFVIICVCICAKILTHNLFVKSKLTSKNKFCPKTIYVFVIICPYFFVFRQSDFSLLHESRLLGQGTEHSDSYLGLDIFLLGFKLKKQLF